MIAKITMDRIKGSMLGSAPRADATEWMARSAVAEGVPGDFVECGVFAGSHVAVMALVLQELGVTDRKVHLFDSFQGIPHAGDRDVDNIDGRLFDHPRDGALMTTGISACSAKAVLRNMERWGVDPGLLVFHAGWVEHTVPNCTVERIALFRVDVDLYEPTKVCMETFYPRMSKGGYVVLDDWTVTGARVAALEVIPDGTTLHDMENQQWKYIRT